MKLGSNATRLAAPEHPNPHPLPEGTVLIGKYRIEKRVGRGGMADVYRARHEVLQQEVAIKVLAPELTEQAEIKSRFLNEARAAARLRNEHVAAVMDVETAEDGTPFIVLEFLEGEVLEAVLEKRGPVPPKDAVDWVLQALEAVAHAHAEKIIHRDLKPANLFLTKKHDGTLVIKVLDFGLSKITSGLQGAVATKTTAMIGSPAFMSPEQLRSAKSVDVRADVWSLGVVLFHLVTGKYPFHGETDGEIFAAILEHPPATLRSIRPELPEELERVCAKGFARDLGARYQNVAELALALGPLASPQGTPSVDRVCRTLGVAPPPPPPAAPAPLITVGNKTPSKPPLDATTVGEAPQPTHPLGATMPKPLEAPKIELRPAPKPAIKPASPALVQTKASKARRREVIGVAVVLGLALVICVIFYGWSHATASSAEPPKPNLATTPTATLTATSTATATATEPPPVTTAVLAPPPSAAPTASAEPIRRASPRKTADPTKNPLLLQRN